MPKRKKADGGNWEGDQSIPIPIQTFLWRQTSPFMRANLGKLCEASCVSFERVIVQNILHGLSPSLCESIESNSRWKLVQAALPHVMHCCASVLADRKMSNPEAEFGPNEIKLLYTLHWIILDAASECEDVDVDTTLGRSFYSYLFPLDSIQLFVYLFAPLIHSLRDSDFQSLKLENGLRMWQPLWEYRQPDVPCFATPVKAKRVMLKAQRSLLKVNFNLANIYIGKGTSNDNIYLGFDDGDAGASSDQGSPLAPLARMSDICALSTTETATSVEIVCEVCEQTVQSRNGEMSCRCGTRRSSYLSMPDSKSLAPSASQIDQEYIAKTLDSAAIPSIRNTESTDVLSASYFDVAVLRCLFCPQWAEEGTYWALRYIHQCLLEVCEEMQHVEFCRERSKSLPTPEVQITPPDMEPRTPPTPRKEFSQVEMKLPQFSSKEPRKEPSFKRTKVSEIKHMIGDKVKIFRRRESCEQFDMESSHSKKEDLSSSTGHIASTEHLTNGLSIDNQPPRPSSALAKLTENEEDSYEEDRESGDSATDIVRRKSMPALRRQRKNPVTTEEDDDDSSGSGKPIQKKDSIPRALSLKPEHLTKPIITITSEGSESLINPVSWLSPKRDSLSTGEKSQNQNGRRLSLQRSYTDSNIQYNLSDEIEEVPGSVFYIQPNGQMNYHVILQAVHTSSSRLCSARICGVILNIISCLLDLGIIERKDSKKAKKEKKKEEEESKENKEEKDSPGFEIKKSPAEKQKEKSAHEVAMETIVKVFKHLGCAQGCCDGHRGSVGDHLRQQGVNCLTRLMHYNRPKFNKFIKNTLVKMPLQDIMDFLHALLAFCVDPSMSNYNPNGSVQRKTSGSQDPSAFKTGYLNNFGEPPDGGPTAQGQIIVKILQPLCSKFVECRKEIQGHENLGLYCDVRQFLSFVKEFHGGTFREVALSGLIDAIQVETTTRKVPAAAPPRPSKTPRRSMSIEATQNDEEREWRAHIAAIAEETVSKSRKSIFRRRTKAKVIPPHGAMSDTELLEDLTSGRAGHLSPRVSMSATEDEPSSGPNTPKRKFSKFNIAWKRAAKSDCEDDSASEMYYESKRDQSPQLPQGGAAAAASAAASGPSRQKKMSFKTASQATLSFLSARKRIEDGLKSWSKRRMSKRGSVDEENNRRGSHEVGGNQSAEVISIREKKLVNAYVVKSGMFRFSFMLDCCHPGTVPDPHLMAALLDLEAPVVARAAIFLECAMFVNRCNRGDWPNWMRMNLPGFRPPGPLHSRGQPSGFRRNASLQRTAGRLFHQWGEALANRLWDLMHEETPDKFSVINQVKDENKKKELRMEDEEEDFLDEATVNASGSECPHALKMMACLLLLEITTFLRETYRFLPKASKSMKHDEGGGGSSRRWSSVLGSPGHSERSNSRSSQGELSHMADVPERKVSFVVLPDPDDPYCTPYVTTPGTPGDRKISFAVFGHHERSDSIHSSTTTISQMDGGGESRRVAAGRKLLTSKMRRGSGANSSFRHNRSFKLKRKDGEEGGGSMRRLGSTKSRKVSTQSLQSAVSTEEHEATLVATEEEVLSDEQEVQSPGTEPQDASPDEDQDYSKFMPWIKVVVTLANTSNFICTHQHYCHPNCYERQRRSCTRLMTAITKIYESQPKVEEEAKKGLSKKDSLKDKLKRRESMFQPSSPTRRRESTPLLEKIKSDVNATMRMKLAAALEKKDTPKKAQKPKDEPPVIKYIKLQAQKLTHTPMAIISKSAPILCDESFVDMMPVAWELLLESDQELAAAAAGVFILSSMKVPEQVHEMMTKQLHHPNVNHRINAVLRFGTLWRFRWQVWPRMEDGANMFFKVPPPSIDFVLPSPTIGLPSLTVVDPPWTPHFKTKVEEVTINQEESKSFVTATTTRRKQQQEMIHRALLAEEDRRRAARENFHLTTIPIMHQAAYEPALHHVSEDHEEALQEEMQMAAVAAARRMSVAPVNRAASNFNQMRNLSGRHGSMFWGRPTTHEGDEERVEHVHTHHMQLAQHFFPSSICAAALPIIHLLEDLEVNADGIAVCEVAEKVIWSCLVEEPTLFLRTFLEKITHRDKQEELIFLLRKLLYHLRELPAQTAHCLFNYLVGFVMFYVRSPVEGGTEAVGEALSILWQVVPSVNGIYFKDLKQTLRKEQCDPTLMITANVPSAKKLIVHGPDLSSIPSQFPILEDTQFSQILEDSLDFFNIPEDQHNSYFLVDTKTNQMHTLNSYVRDFYFFRRNFYPQLSLVSMDPNEASRSQQSQAFTLKIVEMGKALFSLSIIESSQGQQMQNHVSFLQEEFLKLPSFPRKALETEFGLHHGDNGREVFGVDMLHKYVWTKLMSTMFQGMSSTITYAGDLPLFLNVINGTLFLHGEDMSMLRLCLATFINAARHFKQVFATSGFLFIMPTILRVYSNHQCNALVCAAIEFVCKQFFILHRNPFMLQMFGSVAPIMDLGGKPGVKDCSKVDPEALFNLLLNIENDVEDTLDILELVEGEKPLEALDFCYIDDPDTFTLLDAINLCVTVAAYASDSVRAMQMLTILEAILPHYLKHVRIKTNRADTPAALREELALIANIGVSMRAMIGGAEALTRNFTGPQRQLEAVNSGPKTTQQNHSNHSPQGPPIYCDEVSDIRFLHMEEGLAKRKQQHVPTSTADKEAEVTLKEFRRPRDALLCVVADYCSYCSSRLPELRKMLADPSVRTPELLDHKAHNRLADITHTLLKIAPYHPPTMRSAGMQRYMVEILPITDWSQDSIRPALHLLLRRMERLFSKIYKKPVLRRHLDWESAANMLKGVYSTLSKFSFVAHLPHLKTLINVCLNIVLANEGGMTVGDSSFHGGGGIATRQESIVTHRVSAPPIFCSAAVKLAAMQMQALGDQFSLEHICGGMSVFPTAEKTANMLLSLILPLCIRMGCGRRDYPKMRQTDISFALTLTLNALLPPRKQQISSNSGPTVGGVASSQKSHSMELGRTASMTSHGRHPSSSPQEMLQNVAFLGLKILMVCFDKQLSSGWHRIATVVSEMGGKLLGGLPLWRFVDFVVTIRSPLFMMLQPFIRFKMMKSMCETEQEYFIQQNVHQKLQGLDMPHPKCKGTILVELASEIRHLKEELASLPIGEMRPRTSTMATDRSDFSHGSKRSPPASSSGVTFARSSSIHDLLEQQMQARLQSLGPPIPLSGKGKYNKEEDKDDEDEMLGSQCSLPDHSLLSRHDSLVGPAPPMLFSATAAVDSPTLLAPQGATAANAGTESPALKRKASQRITAAEGSLILEKYIKKQREEENSLEAFRSMINASPRKLHRQGSIYQRGHMIRQSTLPSSTADILFESDTEGHEDDEPACSVSQDPPKCVPPCSPEAPPPIPAQTKLTRKKCVKFSLVQRFAGDGPQEPSATEAVSDPSPPTGSPLDGLSEKPGSPSEMHPRMHRLQRQDARSRKTFKIKRHRSTIKANILRSATMKGCVRSTPLQPAEPRSPTFVPGMLERIETQGEEPPEGEAERGAEGGRPQAETSSSPTPEPVPKVNGEQQQKVRSSRPRFMPKAKSHDDSTDVHVSSGTARGRIIARQGMWAQAASRSRSPSSSPTRCRPAVAGAAAPPTSSSPDTYMMKCDSIESLNTEENSALLKEEDKSKSQSSLLIYFDEHELENMQDTCV